MKTISPKNPIIVLVKLSLLRCLTRSLPLAVLLFHLPGLFLLGAQDAEAPPSPIPQAAEQAAEQNDNPRSLLPLAGFESFQNLGQLPVPRVSASWQRVQRPSNELFLISKIVIPQDTQSQGGQGDKEGQTYHLNRDLLDIRTASPELHLAELRTADFPPVSGEVQGIRYYTGSLELRQAINPSLSIAGSTQELELDFQLCDEAGNCFLPQTLTYRFEIPQSNSDSDFWQTNGTTLAQQLKPASLLYWIGILLLSLLGGIILNLMPCIFPIFSLKLQKLLQMSGATSAAVGIDVNSQASRQAGEGPHRQRSGRAAIWRSLLYTLLGIELSFAALGLLLLVLWPLKKGVLWGFQLQQPLVVYGVLLLFFLMALSLLGVFKFWIPHWIPLTQRHQLTSGAARDIGSGALIVLLGTPCSAPLLGPIMGLFLLQSSLPLSLIGLSMIGLGLWLPYATLATVATRGADQSTQALSSQRSQGPRSLYWLQALQSHMPFIEISLGFIMLATGLYFYSVLQSQISQEQALLVLWSLLSVAWMACLSRYLNQYSGSYLPNKIWKQHKLLSTVYWLSATIVLYSVFVAGLGTASRLATAEGVTAANIATLGTPNIPLVSVTGAVESGLLDRPDFLAYSGSAADRAAVQELRNQGYGIFIEYTAAWCITCKVNQLRLLHTQRFRRLLQENRVLYLKADLTTSNPLLEAELNSLGRASLPVYRLYTANHSDRTDSSKSQLLPTLPSYGDFARRLAEA